MINEYTWPNFRGNSDRNGTKVIVDDQKFSDDVQYGHSKLFIKSPQTVFALEEARSKVIPTIVVYLQVGSCRIQGCQNSTDPKKSAELATSNRFPDLIF